MSDQGECWEPQPTNAEWCNRLRADYPDKADWSDERLRDHFADGRRYADMWDHLGDARDDWEQLADAYLKLKAELIRP